MDDRGEVASIIRLCIGREEVLVIRMRKEVVRIRAVLIHLIQDDLLPHQSFSKTAIHSLATGPFHAGRL